MKIESASPSRRFRQLMGRYATGVSVIACGDSSAPVAMTANSLTSVSLEPPLVLFCVRNEGRLLDAVLKHAAFSVNVLRADQIGVSQRYAGATSAQPAPRWRKLGAVPVLEEVEASLACRLHACHRAGDHTIIIGLVEDMSDAQSSDAALVFLGGCYHRLPLQQQAPKEAS